MSSICCYKGCDDEVSLSESKRTEVRTSLPSGGLKSLRRKSDIKIEWSGSGDAVFHRECWSKVVAASRSRGKPGGKGKLSLSKVEKAMVKEAEETAEHHDDKETLREEGRRVAEMIMTAKHCCTFTGAGISTSAGIGDYRGKSGKWTEQDRGAADIDAAMENADQPTPRKRRKLHETTDNADEEEDDHGEEEENDEEDGGVPYEDLRPTYTHEALVKLSEMGHLHYIISQNGDGLHGLSGIPQDKISELHGNVFLEICEKCGARYERPFYVMDDHASLYFEELADNGETDIIKPKHAKECKKCGLCHRTGRRCEKKGCKGFLIDSIINFRDNLEDAILDRATDEARKCDLMLCLGTTMTVTPACNLVKMGKRPLRLVICNRQETDLDGICLKVKSDTRSGGTAGEPIGSRVFGDCDALMREVMANILASEELQAWESARQERMKIYDSKREASSV